MKLEIGSVVMSSAGKDSGCYFVITEIDEKWCFIADGKNRKLSSPKRKNRKHLNLLNNRIDISNITDKKLRTLLKYYSE